MSRLLTVESLPAIQVELMAAGLDGWLLYDFRGNNPVAMEIAGIPTPLSRRIFVLVPSSGVPTAITHNIEQGVWRDWPQEWKQERYSAWPALESLVEQLVRGKRVAMEYSPGDAVPYLDRVPAGILEMVQRAGGTVVSSADLVSTFYARWTPAALASHKRAAEHVARIAHEAFGHVRATVRSGGVLHEHEVQQRILDSFARADLETYSPPNVSVGPNAADPHYEGAAERPVRIDDGNILLIDLWAREPGGVYADQTWMASLGPPSDEELVVWRAIRDARDTAITFIRDELAAGRRVSGGAVDDAARGVIASRGHGEHFTHRTGHSIDARDIHGAGPNLDNLETRDVRLLLPGVGFSIEPGIYLRGRFGMRTEVNAYMGDGELVVTPARYQHELIVL
ncbi:MAG: M24 family metallopeptidase [Gemmatimonadota bacterium]